MNQGRGFQPLLDALSKTAVPDVVVTDRHDERKMAANREGAKSLRRREEFAIAKRSAGGRAGVIYKDDLGEDAHRASDVEDNFTVPASTPDDQFLQALPRVAVVFGFGMKMSR